MSSLRRVRQGLFAFLLGGLLLPSVFAEGNARVLSGKADVRRAGSATWRAVNGKVEIKDGDSFRTGASGKAEIRLPDGHRLAVREKSALTLLSSGKDLQFKIQVLAGRVRAMVRKLRQGNRFEVRTPLAVAAVRGTEFEMEVFDKGVSRLSVIEGVVAFKDLDGLFDEVSVLKGQSVTIEPDQAPRPPEPLPREIFIDKTEKAVPPEERKEERKEGEDPAKKEEIRQEIEREQDMDLRRDAHQEQGANMLKENVFQEGKALVDAFGQRVRLEEYVLRPAPNQFTFVAVSRRETRTDTTRLDIYAQFALPPQVDVKGLFYQEGPSGMNNWATGVHRIATQGGDYMREWRDGGNPISYSVTEPGGPHLFQQVVFNHWFVEARADGQEPVLLAHWIPTTPFAAGGAGYVVTQTRDDNDLRNDGALDIPWGYTVFEKAGGITGVGNDRLIDGHSTDLRLQYFTNDLIHSKYLVSEGYNRTAVLMLDGQPFVFGDDAQRLGAREARFEYSYDTLGAADIAMRTTNFRITDDGRRLSKAEIQEIDFQNAVNFQTVFEGDVFAGRKIDLVTSPLTFRPPDEGRLDK